MSGRSTDVEVQTADAVPSAVAAVLSWVSAQDAAPLPHAWIPGTTEAERRGLAALGGAATAYWKGGRARPMWVASVPEVVMWLDEAPPAPTEVGEALAAVIAGGPASIAMLYDAVVTPKSRRHLGTFFTPPSEARWMIQRWTERFGAPDTAIDVGAGVGIFTLGAHRAWPNAEVVPVDVNPVTLGLIALIAENDTSDRLHPVLGDFAAWSQTDFSKITGSRLILGNPPYTRLQLIPASQRDSLRMAAGGLCGARASLSALMLGTALTLLEDGDGVCLLLPAQWLESDYAEPIRQWLWSHTKRRVEVHLFESRLFPDAQVDAVALLVGPKAQTDQPLIFGAATSTTGKVTSTTRPFPRAETTPVNWRRLLHDDAVHQNSSGTPLSDYATIRRGIATGANSFFTLSDMDVATWRLPGRVLQPFVQRTRDHTGSRITLADLHRLGASARRHLVTIDALGPHEENVRRYIEHGEQQHLHERHLTRVRPAWFALAPEAHVFDVIIGASARDGFAVFRNDAGATIANNLYGLTWRPEVPDMQREAILRWLRSGQGQSALFAGSRRHAEGLRKIEVRDLAGLIVPSSLPDS